MHSDWLGVGTLMAGLGPDRIAAFPQKAQKPGDASFIRQQSAKMDVSACRQTVTSSRGRYTVLHAGHRTRSTVYTSLQRQEIEEFRGQIVDKKFCAGVKIMAKHSTTGCHGVNSIARCLRINTPLSPGIARSLYSSTTSDVRGKGGAKVPQLYIAARSGDDANE